MRSVVERNVVMQRMTVDLVLTDYNYICVIRAYCLIFFAVKNIISRCTVICCA